MNEEFRSAVNYHLLNDLSNNCQYHVVLPSSIEQAGLGLIAKDFIPKGTVISSYRGNILKLQEALRLKDKSYLMRLGPQCYVDAQDYYYNFSRFINDCRNQHCYNVRFLKCPHSQCAFVISCRDIEVNEELFVDYGRWYWIGKNPKRVLFLEGKKTLISAKEKELGVQL